ncbi:MAG: SPFH domain-containing protein [Planctomycetota bacterium]
MNSSRPLFSPDPPAGGPPARQRPSSLSLRTGGGPDGEPGANEGLDPANQSLADALRVTLRIVQIGMLVLAALFAISGSQSVRENERGVKLMFGAIVDPSVQPGLSINPPYPVGELIRVDSGQSELKLHEEFWVFAANKADLAKPLDQLNATTSLTPGQGGSTITADGNLAHTQWKVIYKREDAAKWATNVLPEAERILVKSAVQRGVVHASAKINIEDMLKQTGGDSGTLTTRAKLIAQAQLDRANSGIVIQQLLLENAIPPLSVRLQFNNVQSAVAVGAKLKEDAETEARKILNVMVGGADRQIRTLLDEYERAVEAPVGVTPPAGTRTKEQALALINALLEEKFVEIDGVTVEGIRSGEVAQIIDEAKRYRTDIVTQREGEAKLFATKLLQFRSNPELLVATEISSAVNAFLGRQDVQLMALPGGTNYINIALNRDPEIMKEILARQREMEGNKAMFERMKKLEEDKHKPKEGSATPET